MAAYRNINTIVILLEFRALKDIVNEMEETLYN
jgi:hypothetical protein